MSITAHSQTKIAKEGLTPISVWCDHCIIPTYAPKPIYPAIARAVKASGTVTVAIKINKKGRVYWAKAISGNLFLRAAAEKAALQNKYSIIYPRGKPVNLKMNIVYNFVL